MSRLPLDRQASGNFHAVERFKSDLLRARREKPIIEPVRTIVTLLHAQQHPVVTRKDATDYTETEIETYSTEELGQLFGACTAAERLVFQFFLGTGCREREVMFATWKEVDLTAGTFTVRERPAMSFKPKDSEERTIPIPSSLVRDLKALKAASKSLLIFPNGDNGANGHLLRDLKEVAKRGKLNRGHCNSTHFGKPVTGGSGATKNFDGSIETVTFSFQSA